MGALLVPSSIVVASSADPSTVGQSVMFTATVTGSDGGIPTGEVTFLDGATVLGTEPLYAEPGSAYAIFSASDLAPGDHFITAVYGGDDVYDSSSTMLSQEVQYGTTTSVTSSANLSFVGQAVTFTATVSTPAGSPTGTVSFYADGALLQVIALNNGAATFTTSGLSAGEHAITAVYSGDADNAGSSGVLDQAVQQVSSSVSVTSNANPSVQGQAVTFTATVTGADGGTPTGAVSFYADGALLGTLSLNNGTAAFTTSTLTVGQHAITAVYGGDSTYTGSSGGMTQTVNGDSGSGGSGTGGSGSGGSGTGSGQGSGSNQNRSTSTFLSGPSGVPVGQPATFTAVVEGSGTPTGTVSFYDNGVLPGSATLGPDGTATFATSDLIFGDNYIAAVYGGDANFDGSTSQPFDVTAE